MQARKLELTYPIELKGSIVKALIVREPSPADVKRIAPHNVPYEKLSPEQINEARFQLYCRVTNLDRAVIDELDWDDISRLDELIGEMVAKQQRGIQWPRK